MKLVYPSYYHDFRCIAEACPDSCCQEWDVEIDEETARRYRAMEGPLGDALRADLYDEDGITYLRNNHGRCPMWRADGLCRIQAELGHEALSWVCQEFPRIRQDYGDFEELGLEMSCPEAARIMLTSDNWSLCSEEVPGGEEPDYDWEIMEILRDSRPRALELLKDETVAVPLRLTQLLLYGYHIQGIIDGGEETPFDRSPAEGLLAQFAGQGDEKLLADFFQKMEILTQRWRNTLESPPQIPVWGEELCRFAQYQVYRYYFQAVSDWDLAARMKMIVAGCVLLAHLPGNPMENIQRYAKEIENDEENVDRLLDGAFAEPALTDANLLALLAQKPVP